MAPKDPTLKAMIATGLRWLDANPGDWNPHAVKCAMKHAAPTFSVEQSAAALLEIKAEFEKRKK